MNLLYYSLFYPIALSGDAARHVSTWVNFQFTILHFQFPKVPPDGEKLTLPDAA